MGIARGWGQNRGGECQWTNEATTTTAVFVVFCVTNTITTATATNGPSASTVSAGKTIPRIHPLITLPLTHPLIYPSHGVTFFLHIFGQTLTSPTFTNPHPCPLHLFSSHSFSLFFPHFLRYSHLPSLRVG